MATDPVTSELRSGGLEGLMKHHAFQARAVIKWVFLPRC